MFDFVERVRWGEAEFEYESVYFVDNKGNRDSLLQSISNDSFCIDHHLQKLNIGRHRRCYFIHKVDVTGGIDQMNQMRFSRCCLEDERNGGRFDRNFPLP
jgi:hypothetical protein